MTPGGLFNTTEGGGGEGGGGGGGGGGGTIDIKKGEKEDEKDMHVYEWCFYVCTLVQANMHVHVSLHTTHTAAPKPKCLIDLLVAFRRGLVLFEHHCNIGDGVRRRRL